jgi:PPK2 family polyphosphate:nucleotide phosphotransferase
MKQYRIKPGSTVKLDKIDPDDIGDYAGDAKAKDEAEDFLTKRLKKLAALQQRLYADSSQALLIVLQAMDTGGKDGTIKRVMSGVDPQGCQVTSFKKPTPVELAHDFLWRVHHEVPPKGYIGIFNRSHYEDVLITRVHGLISDKLATERFELIKQFEKMLAQTGTTILKFFLHISKDEQQARLEERLRDPEKRWKFNADDLAERKFWPKYTCAYEDAIAATSTDDGPWYVVPANHKWFRNVVVAETIVSTLERMNPKPPPLRADLDLEKLKKELKK